MNIFNLVQPNIKLKSRFLSIVLSLIWILSLLLNVSYDSRSLYLIIWLFLLIVGVFFTSTFTLTINSIQKIWLIFILYSLLITVVNQLFKFHNFNVTSKDILMYILEFLIILYIVQFCDRRYFFKIIRNFLALCTVAGVLEYFTRLQLYTPIIKTPAAIQTFGAFGILNSSTYRLMLFFGHPIYFATFLNIFCLLLIFIPFENRILNSILFVLSLFCLLLTQSRSGWISFLIIMLMLLLKSGRLRNINHHLFIRIIFGVVLLIVIINFLSRLDPDLFNSVNNRLYAVFNSPEEASGARMANLALVNYINNDFLKLFGNGNGFAISLLQNNPTINGWTLAVDNQYLTFFLDFGVVGLCFIVVFIIYCLKKLINTNDPINVLIISSIFIIFISGYFFEFYTQNYINFFLFILISFIDDKNRKKSAVDVSSDKFRKSFNYDNYN